MIRSGTKSRPEFLENLQVLRAHVALNVMFVHLVLVYPTKPPLGLYWIGPAPSAVSV